MARVYEVLEVSLAFNKKMPPEFVVSARGRTERSGYTGPELVRVIYVRPPEDGIQDYEFEATPPSGPSLEVLTPIQATDVWSDPPSWVRGARVHAESNSLERALSLTT
jgi:hypothetical protein